MRGIRYRFRANIVNRKVKCGGRLERGRGYRHTIGGSEKVNIEMEGPEIKERPAMVFVRLKQ